MSRNRFDTDFSENTVADISPDDALSVPGIPAAGTGPSGKRRNIFSAVACLFFAAVFFQIYKGFESRVHFRAPGPSLNTALFDLEKGNFADENGFLYSRNPSNKFLEGEGFVLTRRDYRDFSLSLTVQNPFDGGVVFGYKDPGNFCLLVFARGVLYVHKIIDGNVLDPHAIKELSPAGGVDIGFPDSLPLRVEAGWGRLSVYGESGKNLLNLSRVSTFGKVGIYDFKSGAGRQKFQIDKFRPGLWREMWRGGAALGAALLFVVLGFLRPASWDALSLALGAAFLPKRRRRSGFGGKAAISTFFLLSLYVPPLMMLFEKPEIISLTEKRFLAVMPDLPSDRQLLKKYLPSFEKYFNDHFGFRKRLIFFHNRLEKFLFNESDIPNVILGKNGWMFMGDGNSVAEFRRSHPFSVEELSLWGRVLEKKRELLAKKGVRYFFVVAPDKHTIYPEFMPRKYNIIRDKSCLDQLVEYLGAHGDFHIIDPRASLLEAKKSGQVYFREDSHWNPRGAYLGYKEIIGAAAGFFPQLKPLPFDGFSWDIAHQAGDDLSMMLDMGIGTRKKETVAGEAVPAPQQGRPSRVHPADMVLGKKFVWPEYTPDRKPYAKEGGRGPLRALVFQDSFGTGLAPYLSEHFARIVFVWDYPDYQTLMQYVEQEKPDIVIEQRVERHLRPMLPKDEPNFRFTAPHE